MFNERYAHYKSIENVGSIKIRDAFFGGRTNNLKFFTRLLPDEEIKYLDFCSLLSLCFKSKMYPTGHAELINENFDFSLNSYFGFVKCKVEAPRKLYLPVLPVSINHKLLFPLCINCAKSNNKSECICIEREFVGTWTTEELKLAINKSYKIKKIYEILHYKERTNIFSGYINTWLKVKQESSDWPLWCKTETDKNKYIKDYSTHENIILDKNKIDKNDALRFIAKIMLNSFWGKMAQRHKFVHICMSKISLCAIFPKN